MRFTEVLCTATKLVSFLLRCCALAYFVMSIALMVGVGELRYHVLKTSLTMANLIPFGLGGRGVIPLGVVGALRMDFILFAIMLFILAVALQKLGRTVRRNYEQSYLDR